MFNWNHFNNGDMQNWLNMPSGNMFQNAYNPMGSGNMWGQNLGSGGMFGMNDLQNWQQIAQQWQSPTEAVDWASSAQDYMSTFLKADGIQGLIEQLNNHGVADETILRECLKTVCDQWFAQAQQLTGITEPVWLHSQLALLQTMRQALRSHMDIPRPLQASIQEMRDFIDAQELCLQSMSQLSACFKGLQQDVSVAFIKEVEEVESIESVEKLFALWATVFERCYNDIALSTEFQTAFGEFVANISKLKIQLQGAIDVQVEKLGLPSHREMDVVLRRIAETRTDLRKLRHNSGSGVQSEVVALNEKMAQIKKENVELKKRLDAVQAEQDSNNALVKSLEKTVQQLNKTASAQKPPKKSTKK